MPLFEVPTRLTSEQVNSIIKSAQKPKKSNSNTSIIDNIRHQCETKLGKYRDLYAVIRDEDTLKMYIDKAVENGVVAIDTETTGLDPLQDALVGISIFTPDLPAAYIPVAHRSPITFLKAENQISIDIIGKYFDELQNVRIIMFNACFDIRFLEPLNVRLHCYFDCYLAARCLNENEKDNGLKYLHNKYCLNGESDAWSFGDLFKGITFDIVPIDSAYVYAARDAEITYQLHQYQLQFLDFNSDKCTDSLRGVSNVFWNIEMPCLETVIEMEDNGIEFDFVKCKELSEKYNRILEEKKNICYDILNEYETQIKHYIQTHQNVKLDFPINIGSPSQLAILLYDIIGVKPVDDRSVRGTGEGILSKIDLPICKAILEYRNVSKLITTYIDKLPKCVNSKDNRIHCKFNQYGADTGRFSSQSPNLQNIPSHNTDIRKMFKARDGYVLLSSDYSQQEPKCLAAMCKKQGDSQLYDTFMAGKDLYSEIASKAFDVSYEECLEFNTDGTTNKKGKERRTQAKSILLGVLYGRGVASIAEQLNCSTEKASRIKNSVFKAFPAIEQFEKESIKMAKTLGYVTTVCGRKRRLPDMMLSEYEYTYTDKKLYEDADLLDFDNDFSMDNSVPEYVQKQWDSKLNSVKFFSDKQKIIAQAEKQGVHIKNNGGFIAEATRQCVNSRIQGSAADLTKLALIRLSQNTELKELGFRLLLPVHDEIIAECPLENVKKCNKLLSDIMSQAAESILEMPVKCDVAVTKEWYGDVIEI